MIVFVRSLVAVLLAGLIVSPASAHVVYDKRTLRQWVQESDVIVVVQFRSGMQVWRAEDGSDQQEFFNVRVLDTLRGSAAEMLDFFSHAEGEPRWRPTDVALLFLKRTGEHADLTRVAQRFPLFTVQGAGQEWSLAPATREEVVSVVRSWAAAPQPMPADAMRAALLRELSAADTRLQTDAITELAYADCQPSLFPDAAAVEPFASHVTDGPLTVPSRAALARALDGCPGFNTAAALKQLTAGPLTPTERTALIRAAGMTDDPTLDSWLASLLADTDPLVRREAVAALGHPRHAAQVPVLARAATTDDVAAVPAVRALAAIGTVEARTALEGLTRVRRSDVAAAARAYLKQAKPIPDR